MDRRKLPQVFPLITFVLIGLVVVAVVGMSTGSWVWFGIALAVHIAATTIVLTTAFRGASEGSEADESSRRLEEAGREATGKRDPRPNEDLNALKHRPPADPIRNR